MPKYAVKLGVIVLTSDKPITMEERERVVRLLEKRGTDPLLTVDDLEVTLAVDSH